MMSDEDVEIDVLGCDDETAAATGGEDSTSQPYHEFLNLSDEDDDDADDDDEEDDDDDLDENEIGEFAEKGKRAHHNALEKMRREDMKKNYRVLKNSIPWLKGKKASRCVILRTASAFMRSKRKELARAQQNRTSNEDKTEKGKKGQDGKESKEKADQK